MALLTQRHRDWGCLLAKPSHKQYPQSNIPLKRTRQHRKIAWTLSLCIIPWFSLGGKCSKMCSSTTARAVLSSSWSSASVSSSVFCSGEASMARRGGAGLGRWRRPENRSYTISMTQTVCPAWPLECQPSLHPNPPQTDRNHIQPL